MDESKMISSVKQQYEALPYPPRNPEDEKNRLLRTVGDSLSELNHCCFKGQRNFNQDFRCLVAGGGTGDSVINLAEQLRETSAEIVYLDMSAASRSIAEQRAAVRGLNNITWLTESLLSIPDLGIGQFDYINCSGVLHHLSDPQEGARARKCAKGRWRYLSDVVCRVWQAIHLFTPDFISGNDSATHEHSGKSNPGTPHYRCFAHSSCLYQRFG